MRYLIDKARAKDTMVVVSPKQPGNEAVNQGALSYAKVKGLKTISRLENVPISDPASLAQAIVSQAGDGGGVVLDFTPPEGVKIMQAAAQQGLIDRVKWGSSTPLNDTSVPDAVGEQWEDKIVHQRGARAAGLQRPGHAARTARSNKKYSPGQPAGFVRPDGLRRGEDVHGHALELPEDQLNKEGINKAIQGIKNYKTDILCKPWYFQEMKLHVPNNTDRTVTPKDGKMVEAGGLHRHPGLVPGPEVRP